jgi:hypothetical protein
VAAYFRDHFVAAYQQVGSFEVIDEHGKLERNGGNVTSYFCTPQGRVIDAITGPVSGDELLDEAKWAVSAYDEAQGGRVGDTPAKLARAHRQAPPQGRGKGNAGQQAAIHKLLAGNPLPPLSAVYLEIFEHILGQRVNLPGDGLERVAEAVADAQARQLPILFVLHKEQSNAAALARWNDFLAQHEHVKGDPLAEMAESFVVVSLPLNALPAASQRLGIRPFAAPDNGSPLFVVTRPNGRQLTAVTTWNKADELTRALAMGLVQQAKEQPHTGEQLSQLLKLVSPVDTRLAGDVRKLQAEMKSKGPPKRPAARDEKVASIN